MAHLLTPGAHTLHRIIDVALLVVSYRNLYPGLRWAYHLGDVTGTATARAALGCNRCGRHILRANARGGKTAADAPLESAERLS